MTLKDFDFPLPERLIALYPAKERDSSRLMVIKKDGAVEHRAFRDMPEYLRPGDMLVVNETMVNPARLTGVRLPSGKPLEFLLVRETGEGVWDVLSKGGYTGALDISGIRAYIEDGRVLRAEGTKEELYEKGLMPLPPYIKRTPDERDRKWYQTVYARTQGSIAAPTAGLHFTEGLISAIERKGVLIRKAVLHVGRGTFAPVRSDNIEDHAMEAEEFILPETLPLEIENTLKANGRVVAVGTTVTRALEGFFSGDYEPVKSESDFIRGLTRIFIRPGYEFRAVTALLTNFHLPASTPLMLASALCGRERLLKAYAEAVAAEYRFFSYGDAMLIE